MVTRKRARWGAVLVGISAFTARTERAHAQDVSAELAPPIAASHDEPLDDFGRRKKGLALTVGVQGGMTYFTEGTPFGTAIGIGRALEPGPNLGIRVSLDLTQWFAIDARGLFMNNGGNDYVGLGALTTVGGFGALRFTLPLKRVRPYVMGGFGAYSISASGASTQLVSGTFSSFELGLGAIIPMTRHVDIGVEYSYSHLNSEVLSSNANADGGDPSCWSLFAQYRFEL